MPNNHDLSLPDAKRFVVAFKNQFSTHTTFKKSIYFDSVDILPLLNQKGCAGMRVYFGVNDSNEMTAILVGVDATGTDMLKLMKDSGVPCPPVCSTNDKTLSGS